MDAWVGKLMVVQCKGREDCKIRSVSFALTGDPSLCGSLHSPVSNCCWLTNTTLDLTSSSRGGRMKKKRRKKDGKKEKKQNGCLYTE